MHRILLIEDSREDRELLLGNLPERLSREAEIVEVDSFSLAERVVRSRGADYFQLVVLDLFGVCPGKDGVETFFALRTLLPNVPCLVLTGSEDESLAQQLMRHGADGYIVKHSMDPRQIYREMLNTIIKAAHSVRLPPSDREAAKQLAETAARLRSVAPQAASRPDPDLREGAAAQSEALLLAMAQLGRIEASQSTLPVQLRAVVDDRVGELTRDLRQMFADASSAQRLVERNFELGLEERKSRFDAQAQDEEEERKARAERRMLRLEFQRKVLLALAATITPAALYGIVQAIYRFVLGGH